MGQRKFYSNRYVGVLVGIALCAGCRRPPEALPPPLPQISGTLALDGLSAPVRIVRDRWGVPHIAAANQDDLFFAQGFVQAQDRLFQMDLWRRSVQGRLSEVLGSNFIERDAMTRRVQYRGNLEQEWTSYGPDVRQIATAFTRGINAWVAIARSRLPEEFVLAGWEPDLWRPEDLLARTDAFIASGNAPDEMFRAQLVVAVGAPRADALLPLPGGARTVLPRELDLTAVSPVVGDLLRQVGPPPFFVSLASRVPVSLRPDAAIGSNAWAVAPTRTGSGAPLLAADPHRPLESPSLRYLVHLQAPGWQVAGATAPWLPGVAIGHNDRIAWSMTASAADTQDLYVERVNRENPRQVLAAGRWVDMAAEPEAIPVKGSKPFEYERLYTPHGVVIALDRERHLAYALRWSGAEPGGAAELAAVAVNRARSWAEFRAALSRWKMPSATFVYADVDGNIGWQVAALTPRRRGGSLPSPGWTGDQEWRGWATIDDLPHAFNPPAGYVAAANGSPARLGRIHQVLSGTARVDVNGFKRLQHDTVAWNAEQLVPLLAGAAVGRPDLEQARDRLLQWDKTLSVDSAEASLYVMWERALRRRLAESSLPSALVEGHVARSAAFFVQAVVDPASGWFENKSERDALLVDALSAAAAELAGASSASNGPGWGRFNAATFSHVLGITASARDRFNVGPFPMGGYAETVMASSRVGAERTIGPSFRAIIDLSAWDRSLVTHAPGQSGSPDSPHFSDAAALWAAGDYFPLPFSDAAVQASSGSTLTLVPR